MSEKAFLSLIEKHPELCADGLGVGGGRKPADLDKLREELKGRYEDFKYACEWLQLCDRTEKPNRNATSMQIKHDAARYFGGVDMRHGAFVAAVMYLDIPYLPVKDQPYAIHVAVASKRPEPPKDKKLAR